MGSEEMFEHGRSRLKGAMWILLGGDLLTSRLGSNMFYIDLKRKQFFSNCLHSVNSEFRELSDNRYLLNGLTYADYSSCVFFVQTYNCRFYDSA